ncbi:MAG: phage baseplate protein, partial [Lentisphaerae bacterium]|nr:phage baseplate protein [Lentisphaerota bacterium]
MTGIDKTTGRYLSGLDHLKQSITDILTTPIGSRVMRREYGSRLPRLVDAPLNSSTLVDLYSATAEALQRWEPRFKLTE